MACFRPLSAWRAAKRTDSGKRAIVFNLKDADPSQPLQIPCGQCVGCRLERSRQWAVRCMHEASLYDDNCFVTLTYDDLHMPAGNTLVVKHFQDFMKRLRFRSGGAIRFYHCGEYGERYGRPHYHACLFNYDFADKKFWRKSSSGHSLYRSDFLESLWPFGLSEIGTVTFESAAYVARYIMKKMTGDMAAEYYQYVDEYGEIHSRLPEYTTMSRRPGIGKPWLDKFGEDIYSRDFVIVNGKKTRPPRFYDCQYELDHTVEFGAIKRRRLAVADLHRANNTSSRHRVREEVTEARVSLLKREVE